MRGVTLGWAAIREVAVAACADPRTVQRVIRGDSVRGAVRDRIERALADYYGRRDTTRAELVNALTALGKGEEE